MFKALFNLIINLVATVIQVICLPLNFVINAALPDFSQKIIDITSTFGTVFNNMSWALGLIPPVLSVTISFIVACEIAKHTIYISTHTLIKVWNIIQKIKFW